MPMLRPLLLFIFGACVLATSSAFAQQPDSDALAAQAVVRSFHEALHRGDTQAIEALLAADAVILENGHLESRQAYLREHLSADIEFAKAVPSSITQSDATAAGPTAWVRSATLAHGKYRNRDIKLSGAELVVLTRAGDGWEIRAIHWSSHPSK